MKHFLAQCAHRVANIHWIKKTLTENRFIVRWYFNWKYRSPDPYSVQISEYQKTKVDHAVSVLRTLGPFSSALEIGCGEGVLTEHLGEFALEVRAVDISDVAVSRARRRLVGVPNVTVDRADLFAEDSTVAYPLVVCSEVLFYFHETQLPEAVLKLWRRVAAGGYLLLVHARALSDDETGIEMKEFGARTIHDQFVSLQGAVAVQDDWHWRYRLTLLRKKE